ncbi:hypothetical protein AB4Y43_16860 [Paraburkholderia sp. BR10872]|uniref:hypothetical protein n=1 Tax=Paraburkholderia sp. BR10872 TaxID=3236989 RepID=UPI0034D17FD4
MMKPVELSVPMLKMISVMKEFTTGGESRALIQQALLHPDGFHFEANLQEQPLARVSLQGEEISFETHDGISGRLYPEFALDAYSLTTTARGNPADLPAVLAALKTAFSAADDVRVSAAGPTAEGADDETFIVDPQIFDTLAFEHQT